MKKYMLLIVLISFMPQLQGARPEKTLTLKNTTDHSYIVTYKLPEFTGPFTVSLKPGEEKQLDHNWEDITEMRYSRDSLLATPHSVDMKAVSSKAEQSLAGPFDYNHLSITILRRSLGSSYRIDARPRTS